ncbi:MAG TPA: AMP-binding protein [Frankiaceae bacterium]|nr:AMP-binding protein [Frankiaceae bacterium]
MGLSDMVKGGVGQASGLVGKVGEKVDVFRVLAGTGVIKPARPDQLVRMGLALARWGFTPATGWGVGAARWPKEKALVDDFGSLTFTEIDEQSSAIATALAEKGVKEGAAVGVLMRNTRWMLLTLAALSKVGADAVLLNTGFGAPQIADVCESEDAKAVIYDAEFDNLFDEAKDDMLYILGYVAEDEAKALKNADDKLTLEGLIKTETKLGRPKHRSRQIILTSGTTGKPKGAPRSVEGPEPAAAFLSKIPLKARGTTVIAAPIFHAWGMAHLGLALMLSSTIVLSRKFDPEGVLRMIDQNKASGLVAVPVMLQRMMELDESVRDKYDTSSLRVVAVSGSAMPGDLATKFMDAFGDVIYSLYGSTEVAYATVADPKDLRDAPGTAGRLVMGTTIKLIDQQSGDEVKQGEVGRIFVGNPFIFSGYTGGQDKDRIGDLVASGDVGRFDEQGRLFIEGRDDEMIVSGGENVFPAEVEDLVSKMDGVREVAVIGVDDEKMGQRLAAYVVKDEKGTLSEDDVKSHVKSNLARHKVPREVHFIEELPRNATGKVVKKDLAEDDDS